MSNWPFPTPEHDKLREAQKYSQKIHEFLEWAQEQHGSSLAHYVREGSSHIVWQQKNTTNLVAEFFEIDLNKLEDEKRAMLDEIRKQNETKA